MKMLGFLDTRIGQRFLAILLCSSLLPLLAMGWYAIKTSENALHQQNLSVLRASSSAAEAQLREFLFHLKLDTLALSNDIKIHDALADGISTADQTELEKLLSWRMGVLPEALEAIVIDGDGKLVASTDERRIVKDFGSAVFFAKGQASYFPGELTRDKAGQISWIMSAPVRDNQMHRLLGVVALRIDPESLSTLTSGQRLLAQGADTQSLRIGDTGETYIVDRSGFMITQSRSFTNAILRRKVDTLPVQAAKDRNEEIVADYKDYRGVAVSGASALIRDMGWVVLTEIDFTQAFGPFLKLRRGLLWLAAGLCIITGTLAWHTARWIVRPLQILKTSDQALAAGDASGAIVPEHDLPNDELGMFVRQRNARVKALLEHQQQLILEQKRRADLAAELEHMSYSIIHDMRAPLRAMIGFAEMIETGADERLSKADRAHLARIKSATTRMDRLIVDVLSYSKVVRGELALHPVDIPDLLRGMVETYPCFQPLKHRIDIPPRMPPVLGNEAALTQCFSNLLENAVKFSKPGQTPSIAIKGERSGEWVRISVQDEGIGIPEAFQKRLFGVFQHGTDPQGGTGIGLAIVRKTVERMGGRVGMVSEPDRGSEFWIELKPSCQSSSTATNS